MTTPPLDLPALREYAKELERDGARSGTIRTDVLRALLDRVERAEGAARFHEACQGNWKARAEAAEAKVAAVREAVEAHPKACDRRADDDPIKCGWKRAVADVTHALDGGA